MSPRESAARSWPRAGLGAVAGVCVWAALAAVLPALPIPVRFLLALTLFLFGSAAMLAGRLSRGAPALERAIVLVGLGTAVAPAVAEFLARLGVDDAFPYVACAAGGATIATWNRQSVPQEGRRRGNAVAACLLLATLAAGTGSIAFAHRLQLGPAAQTIFGEYDSVDLSYYAAITAEATHRVPPTAPFHSGHELNYSFYPQLLLATVHRFAHVPILDMYFRLAWPAFLVVGALTAFCFIRLIASDDVAWLGVALLLVGGDLSYLAAWLLPHATYEFDYVIWPSNFLSTTAEVLQFNTWTPTLPVMFAALYAVARHEGHAKPGWLIVAAFAVACLLQFKTFAFAVMVGSLAAAALFAGRDRAGRRRLAITLAGSVVAAIPFLYRILSLYDESRSRLRLDYFLLPKRMLLKLDLTQPFDRVAARIAETGWLHDATVLLPATMLFLLIGVGMRWIGVPRAIRACRSEASTWRLLGWIVVVGTMIPFVVVTDPYHDTLQFYETALYVLWIFAALAMVDRPWTSTRTRAVAIALVFACAIPSPIHYLVRTWNDGTRPLGVLSRDEMAVADYLRALDPERTVVLHDRPSAPSLVAIRSERRTVLAWSQYVRGSGDRQREVERFFRSADRELSIGLDILRKYHVTHVIIRPGDRVHPAVLDRLRPVLRTTDAVLYEVPPLD